MNSDIASAKIGLSFFMGSFPVQEFVDVSRRKSESSSGAGATVEADDEIHLRDSGTVVTSNWIDSV
jgi:hypothetical protein